MSINTDNVVAGLEFNMCLALGNRHMLHELTGEGVYCYFMTFVVGYGNLNTLTAVATCGSTRSTAAISSCPKRSLGDAAAAIDPHTARTAKMICRCILFIFLQSYIIYCAFASHLI